MSNALMIGILHTIVPIALGYALARWLDLPGDGLRALLRYGLFPAVLFEALMGPLTGRTVVLLLGCGAAMVVLGLVVVRLVVRRVASDVSLAAACPAVAAFAFPVMTLTFGLRGAGPAAVGVLFVAVAVAATFADLGERGFGALIREPWVYAAIAALVLRGGSIRVGWIEAALDPLAAAGWTVLFVHLGTRLYPAKGLALGAAWAGAVARVAVGLAVALAVLALYKPVSSVVGQSLILVGLAPAATASLSLIRDGGEREDGRATVVASTLVALVALVLWRAL